MVLLANDAQVVARFYPFGDRVNQHKIVARLAPNIPKAQKSFLMHPMELLGDVGHVESHFGPFGVSVSVGAR